MTRSHDGAADTIFALTSVPPTIRDLAAQRACIRSWRAAGLQVKTFNHTSEVEAIRCTLNVDVVPVSDGNTCDAQFGKRHVTINTMLDWAADRNVPALLINADIQLRMAPWELRRARWRADGGLCYFVRHNHDGDPHLSARERYGIDAFLLHGRDASLFPRSRLSMGLPFWDYWLPHTFLQHGRPLLSVEFPAAFHRAHPSQWTAGNWHSCALEFARLTGTLGTDRSLESCKRMSSAVRASFGRRRIALRDRPPALSRWVKDRFRRSGSNTFVQLGTRPGEDADFMAALPGVTIHRFEPDRVGLDSYAADRGLQTVDLVWGQIRGAAADLIEGGRKTLARTRYLYTRYSSGEISEGSVTLPRMMEMLPAFRVVELWAEHVLLENRSLA